MTAEAHAQFDAEFAGEADRLIAELDEAMGALLALIDAETRLVRAAKLKEAGRLGPDKIRLARRYMEAIGRLKAYGGEIAEVMPDRIERLRRRHDAFRENLQHNMAVLATAKSVSEGLVRQVATEMAAGDRAQVYGGTGREQHPTRPASRPVTLNRSF